MGLPNPSRETEFLGANADGEIPTVPVQLTTSRIGNLTQLIHALALYVTIHNWYVFMPGLYPTAYRATFPAFLCGWL